VYLVLLFWILSNHLVTASDICIVFFICQQLRFG